VVAPLRGQVLEYVQGSRQYRIVIISGDEYNENSAAVPWGLVIDREGRGIPGYLIPLRSE